MKKIILIITLLNHFYVLSAQVVLPIKQFHLNWDNDVMMTTDHYYTQGLGIAMCDPFLVRNPLNKIFIKPRQADKALYSLSVFQQTYTPKDIRSDEIQYNDRPYAGVLLVTSGAVVSDISKNRLFKSEIDIGVMGPASGAGKVQYVYHDITNNPLPNGWHHQQYNWPVVNYNLNVYQQWVSEDWFNLMATGGARVGTLHDDASLGMMFRIGKMQNYIESLNINYRFDQTSNWQYYIEAEANVTAVMYNATLQGGWYRNRKIYYIPFSDLTYLVPKLKGGLVVMYNVFGLQFNVNYIGKEFEGGSHHWYHKTTLFLSF
nr:lipid A deacylase LpxR family protein [uncultured Carboxylicivirga sp.]